MSSATLGYLAGTAARVIFLQIVQQPLAVIDPLAFVLVPAPLALAAFLALSALPARRASIPTWLSAIYRPATPGP